MALYAFIDQPRNKRLANETVIERHEHRQSKIHLHQDVKRNLKIPPRDIRNGTQHFTHSQRNQSNKTTI